MKDKYTHIFEPLTVRTMTIKNRICMMPMGTNYGEQNGEMSFLHIDYYRQRAKGGTGLLIVENANVDFPQGLTIPSYRQLFRVFTRFCGRYASLRRPGFLSGVMLVLRYWLSRIGRLQPVSASIIPSRLSRLTPRH